jgi:chemotaxis-related protein WspD
MEVAAPIEDSPGRARPVPCWQSIGVWGCEAPRCPQLAEVVHCRNCPVFRDAGRALFLREPPPDYGADWAAAVSAPIAPPATAPAPAVVFRIGDERFALPLIAVMEVLEPRAIRRLPHHHDSALLGLVNVGGELHLCMSLEVVLGSAPVDTAGHAPGGRLLALGEGTVEWAVPVEETLGVAQIDPDTLEEPPAARAGAGYVRGMFEDRGHPVGLLDHVRLTTELRRRLA